MEKTYDPHKLEARWYRYWEENNYFAPRGQNSITNNPLSAAAASRKPGSEPRPYCIMIPPPNVTGSLHMGHAFQDTIMDALTRYHRMLGDNTLWQAGSDHAGIATQMVVERLINAEGKTRHDYGRKAFIEKIWEWKEHSGNTITRQLRRMGASLDWEHERFTMDDGLSNAVREVFIRLYEEGLIYRGKRLVNWDPVLHTAVSDLEVIATEEAGYMWHMRYPLSNGQGHLVVSTTRPETMLGDCALAVNPQDPRYQHLIGELVELPLTGRRIPVIADEHADPEFGTGCVKITPAHDFNDYQVWLRHRDEKLVSEQPYGGLINIFTPDAVIRKNSEEEDGLIPMPYQGLDRYQARKQIVADLQTKGLLEKIADHKLMVPRGDRSGSVIEPFLTDQWYVKIKPLAKPAIAAVENGSIRFVPDNWKNTYFEWMRNIEDWCISRQIWWGHRIPAWYDPQGNIYVGRNEEEVRQKHGLAADYPLDQDEDVLDTWFSSALWPFSTLGWPEDSARVRTFYPTSVLVTGFDIIFFWVARMIMFGLKFMHDVPFREVYIHGLVRDSHGDKMSKSKGNVLDPIDLIDGIELEPLIEKRTSGMMQPQLAKKIERATRTDFPQGIPSYGTDALRFTFAALATTGRDIKFDLGRIEGYRNFCNKLWNACRFVLMNTDGEDCGSALTARDPGVVRSVADRWIISRMQSTISDTTEAIENYRFDQAAKAIYEFTWNEYCDWYLELCKPVLNGDTASPQARRGARQTLVRVLETLLRLIHPIMPFISEEVWQQVAPLAGINGATIMTQPYPRVDANWIDQAAVDEMEWVMNFTLGVRRIKGEMNIPPGKPLPVLLQHASERDLRLLGENRHYLDALARLASVEVLAGDQPAPDAATALVGEMKVLIPMAGLIDKEAELSRLRKETEKISGEVERLEKKLANPHFVEKAPEKVVRKEQEKLTAQRSARLKLEEQIEKITKL